MSDLDAPARPDKSNPIYATLALRLGQEATAEDLARWLDDLAAWARAQGPACFWFAVGVDLARRSLSRLRGHVVDLNLEIRGLQDDLVSARPPSYATGRYARPPEDDD